MSKNPNFQLYEVEPVSSIRNLLEIAEKEVADHIAFRYRVREEIRDVTYHDFIRDVNALGSVMRTMGIGEGEHICQIGENSYNWIVVYLSVLAGNRVFVPIDKELPEADICHIATHGEGSVLFYTAKYEEIVKRNADTTFADFKYFVHMETAVEEDYVPENARFRSFRQMLSDGYRLLDDGYADYIQEKVDPAKLKMIVYTSGTTGIAKGVMLSEHNLISIVYYGLQVSTVYDVGLSVLPYHHTYEAVAGLLVSLHHHSTICINENLKTVMKNLATYKPDYIYLVPAFAEEFYRRIWQNAKKTGKEAGLKALIKTSNGMRKVGIDARKKMFATIHEAFGGNLKKIVCGGAPIRPEIGEFFDAIGIDLINGYGITECSPLVSVNPDTFNDCRTAGLPLPCCTVKIDDPTPEGIGEICVKGDIVMLGYYKEPEKTAEVLSEDGWFRTGDYGKINEKGQLIITGRKKNIIVLSNGKNIYPEEIENYIMNVPYIKEVVVYGLKNEYGDETKLCAEVFLNAEKLEELHITDPVESLKKDIAKACEHLPMYKKVAQIVIRAKEFDKNSSNKIKRQNIGKEQPESAAQAETNA